MSRVWHTDLDKNHTQFIILFLCTVDFSAGFPPCPSSTRSSRLVKEHKILILKCRDVLQPSHLYNSPPCPDGTAEQGVDKSHPKGGQLPSSAPSVVKRESRGLTQVPCVASGWTFPLIAKPSSAKIGPGEHCPQPHVQGGLHRTLAGVPTCNSSLARGQSDPYNLATLGIRWTQCPGTRKQSACPLLPYLLYHPKHKGLPQLNCKKMLIGNSIESPSMTIIPGLRTSLSEQVIFLCQ